MACCVWQAGYTQKRVNLNTITTYEREIMKQKRKKLRFMIEEGSQHGQKDDQVGRWYIMDRENDTPNRPEYKLGSGSNLQAAVDMAAQLNINYGYAERVEHDYNTSNLQAAVDIAAQLNIPKNKEPKCDEK